MLDRDAHEVRRRHFFLGIVWLRLALFLAADLFPVALQCALRNGQALCEQAEVAERPPQRIEPLKTGLFRLDQVARKRIEIADFVERLFRGVAGEGCRGEVSTDVAF